MPLLGDRGHQEMVRNLEAVAAEIDKPSAIIVISAHWEEKVPTVTCAENPSLIYDYAGFPPASYQVEYRCSGEPILAEQLHRLLNDAGIDAGLDKQRGIDHGVFVPLKIMYPEADVPCVELSLVQGLDPSEGFAHAPGCQHNGMVSFVLHGASSLSRFQCQSYGNHLDQVM